MDSPPRIAVIGMAGRFPGAADIDGLWENLCAGVESIRTHTADELIAAGVDPALAHDARYVRSRGALEGVPLFDAAFFGMSPSEAAQTDPQHRLFLECAWEAMERAGYDPSRIEGPVGVYAGAGSSGYWLHHLAPSLPAGDAGDVAAVIGNDKDHLTTRVAYKLGLSGPSITVQTACSTSLVAVQLACQGLLSYQCDLALAGGVAIGFPLGAGHLYHEGLILSPDGHCRAFDARASGTVNGDGAGVVLLKRLDEALADGDHIHAVILGAAVNNDGALKAGYTAPSVDGQAEVVSLAHALAQVDAATIGYVETHGTGTPLGDPIEIAALTQAFRDGGAGECGTCALGALKPNIGHLNTAAGVAGLIKAALVLEREAIPPVIHYTAPNPEIPFAGGPFFVNATLRPWPRGAAPRRAGVSAFGFGGTNAHVVLEEAPAAAGGPRPAPSRPSHLLLLSARSAPALEAAAGNLAHHLERHPGADLGDVAFTLQVGRRAFDHRRALVCSDTASAIEALRAGGRDGVAGSGRTGVVFMFPGQGAQHPRMAGDLYDTEPVFRREVDRCLALLDPDLARPLGEAWRGGGALLDETRLAQPAIFVVEYALAQVLLAAGVTPRAMIGHSLGEYVAATLAGVLSLQDALSLVCERGRLMQALPPGAMLAVPLPERDLSPLLDGALSIAAVNGPGSCVVSGPTPAIEALERRLADMGIDGRRLRVERAFHSAMMDPILGAFADRLRRTPLRAPRYPYLSNVTGTWVTAGEATDPGYWLRHLRETVRFSGGLDELLRGEPALLLEVGPGRALSALVEARGGDAIPCLARPGSPEPSSACFLSALGRLWMAGVDVDWKARSAGEGRRRLPLPTYPFERQRFWIDAARATVIADDAETLDATEATLRAKLAIRPIDDHPGLVEALDRFCASHLCAYLRACGVDVDGRSGDGLTTRRALAAQLGIVPKLARLFDAFVAILAEDGVVSVDGEALRFTGRADALGPPAAIRADVEARWPGFRGLFDFVDHCAGSYPDALSGRVEAISVLYPGGSPELITRVERDTVAHRADPIYLGLLTEAVRRIASSSPGRTLRILEVGGGQGLLTWPLVEALQDHDVAYCFTDLGKAFVDDARAEAARRGVDGRMRFAVLDASRDARAQGFEPGGFDVVVAYNVVHATRDVAEALGHLGALLAPGGTLGLVEAVRTRRWDVLTWGLAEGFWYYDDAFRRGSPLLDLGTWEEVLKGRGLADVRAYPRDPAQRARADHGLVLAREPRRAVPSPRPSHANGALPPRPSAHALSPRPALRAPYLAPRDDLERRVAAVAAEVLGIERVGVADDFFELGADSLVMLRLTDRLRRELGREVPAHAAFRGATVAQLAAALSGARGARPASPAVPIQPEGRRPPLFFVHPAAGVVFPYVELSRQLGTDQPLYGLQALGLDGETEPDQTIEAMAAHYVEAIRAVSPSGPYHLGGFSFGCLVAFEVAQQLVRAGAEVALLAMVDEPAPVHGHRPTVVDMGELLVTGVARSIWPYLHDYFYMRTTAADRALPAPPPAGRRRAGVEVVESFLARATIANYVPRESLLLATRQPAMVPMFRLFAIHLRETRRYRPRAYPHRVTYFRATGHPLQGDDPTQGWAQLAAGGVDVHDVPGEHLTLLRQPNVRVLAEKLEACLREAARRRG